jgi:hypothetical protein
VDIPGGVDDAAPAAAATAPAQRSSNEATRVLMYRPVSAAVSGPATHKVAICVTRIEEIACTATG